jgi:hypothetical protein
VSKRREWVAIGVALALDGDALAMATCEERVSRIASLATRYGLLPAAPCREITTSEKEIRRSCPANDGNSRWLSELALRLASDPGNVEVWAGEQRLRVGVTRLFEVPTLARAARFLVLATDRHLQSHVAPGELYSNWGWT